MLAIILFGAFGSILGDLLFLRKTIKSQKKLNFLDIEFCIPILINIFIGFGFIMVYYHVDNCLPPLLAVHIGASSPVMARVLIP